ncbi:MAG: hypothetical protein K6F92_08075 [Lachnospiraceae bacterium]|nr:hypothetical protein [Lachnospiraceae bacterium]
MQHKHVFDRVYMEKQSPDGPTYFVKKCKYCSYSEIIGVKSIKSPRPTPNEAVSCDNFPTFSANQNTTKKQFSKHILRLVIIVSVLSAIIIAGLVFVGFFKGKQYETEDNSYSEQYLETTTLSETVAILIETYVENTQDFTTVKDSYEVETETETEEVTFESTADIVVVSSTAVSETTIYVTTEEETTEALSTIVEPITAPVTTAPETTAVTTAPPLTETETYVETTIYVTTIEPTTTQTTFETFTEPQTGPQTALQTEPETEQQTEPETTTFEETLSAPGDLVGMIFTGEEVIDLVNEGYSCIIVTNMGLKYYSWVTYEGGISQFIIASDSYTCNLADDSESLVMCQF